VIIKERSNYPFKTQKDLIIFKFIYLLLLLLIFLFLANNIYYLLLHTKSMYIINFTFTNIVYFIILHFTFL